MQPLSDANYVLEYEPLTVTDDPRTLDAGQCRRTATYADGLGRPVQTVRIGASPSGADLVTRTDYDSAGRESRSWLPVPVPNNGGKYVAPPPSPHGAESFYADEAPTGLDPLRGFSSGPDGIDFRSGPRLGTKAAAPCGTAI